MREAFQGPIIDACVHHEWSSQTELTEYLPAEWREYVGRPDSLPGGVGMMPVVPRMAYESPMGDYVPQEQPSLRHGDSAGLVPGADLELISRSVIRATHPDRAILSYGSGMAIAGHPNQYLALELVKAANRWTLDRWLTRGKGGFFGLVLAPPPHPEAAAREVTQAGQHAGMVGVLMAANNVGKPFGHSVYHPIYTAAAGLGLPIVIHSDVATADSVVQSAGGGQPATYAEYRMFQCQALMTHAVSLIAQGVLEKFPGLKVVLSGAGVTWVTTFLWRLDNDYLALRREVPWMKTMPSEYFRDRFRILTHPFAEGPSKGAEIQLLSSVQGIEDMLCFGSGYPRWDADDAADVAVSLPEDWRSKVMQANAAATFRWPRRQVEPASPDEERTEG
jgi:uncharacterized protein